MTSTPANGTEPNRPAEDGPLAPTAPGTPTTKTLTTTQKALITGITLGAVIIAGIGFAGSYHTVTEIGRAKGFGRLSGPITLGIDIGIGVFLALDLLLTWLRIPYPFLRYGAWSLTAATIAFNASAAWPDPIGVGMHAVTPLLFVIAVEAARHATGRIADITADKHYEMPPLSRWLLAPISTFRLYRRMRVWGIRSYQTALTHQQQISIYIAQLRKDHGRTWWKNAPADKLLVLKLARRGMSIADAIDKPKAEARKLAEEEDRRQAAARAAAEAEAEAKHQEQLRKAEAEAKRRAEIAEAEAAEAEARHRAELAEVEAEAKRRSEVARAEAAEAEARLRIRVAEAEAKRKAEADEAQHRLQLSEAETETRLRLEAKQKADAEAARLRSAETDAHLAKMARQQRAAAEAEEAERRERERAAALREAEEDRKRRAREDEERQAAEQRERDQQARAEAKRLRELAETRSATATPASTSGSAHQPAATSDSASVSASAVPRRPIVTASVSASTSGTSNLGGRRSKRASEVEAVLAEIAKSRDPKSVSLKWVEQSFGLTQTTAYDRLSTAQKLWSEAQQKTA
ncbi:DUF2637 domain-containing protein [Streptomyces sp. DSM 41534]